MALSTIAHHVFPATFRDIGSGLYHLAARDATPEQCEKLVSSTLRVVAVAGTALAIFACIFIENPNISSLWYVTVNAAVYILDPEISHLTFSAFMSASGVFSTALGVSLFANSFFSAGTIFTLLGAGLIGAGWFVSRISRDTQGIGQGLLTEWIDNVGNCVGDKLYYKFA